MSDTITPKCPQCGAELPGGSPGQVCPRCAAAFLKAAPTEMPDDATGSPRPFTPPPVAELAPLFPQLEIIELIGQGGMGAVYKARQKELDRIVALKILPPGIGDMAFAERFAREAKALARLNHPGIVTIYEFGRSNGLFFFLMEFVDGTTLRQVLHGGLISPREALAIVPAICDARQYAHDQGIVHRDIKPENILLDRRGRTKVADFGLAKLMESGNAVSDPEGPTLAASSTATHASKVLGTPQYMAPEQFEHPASVDHRADIYALGVVFYQMLTGELPGKPIEPPSKTVRIDVRLDEVVLRALEKNPERRYAQASQIKTAVETIAKTPSSQHTATAGSQWPNQGVDYRSKATLFGLPLLHVTSGVDPRTGRARVARGVVAIGGIAQGILAFGGMAMGGIAIGGVAMGVFAFGGCTLGLMAFGGLAIALIAALGGGAVAPIAIGGGAVGYLAFGGKGVGPHVLDAVTKDPFAAHFFLPWAQQLLANMQWINAIFVILCVGIGVGVPLWIQNRVGHQTVPPPRLEGKLEPPLRTPSPWPGLAHGAWLGAGVAATLAIWFCWHLVLKSFSTSEAIRNHDQMHQVSATTARKGDIGVRLSHVGTVESSNSVVFAISEEDSQEVIRKFNAHQALTVEADNIRGERFGHGFLSGVDNRIVTATGTLKCKATLVPEGDNLMVPGLFLTIHLLLEVKHDVTLVPSEAIQRDPQSAFVWVVRPNHKATRRSVRVGTVDGKWAEIQSGLSPGEVVASGGFNFLGEGQNVRYKLPPSAESAQASSKPDEQTSNKDLEWLKIQSLAGWISDLQNPDPNMEKTAERALIDMGTNVLPGFLKILSESTDSASDDDTRRYNTAHALRFMGSGVEAGLPDFVTLLKSGDQGKAYAGARALAFSAPMVLEAFSILTNALTDSAAGVRDAASHGVGLCLGIGMESNNFAESALPLLVRNLSDKIDYIRSDTAVALQEYANRQSMRFPPGDAKPDLLIPPLIELLHDKYSFARFYASEALWCGCYKEAIKPWIPAIQKLLSDPDEGVRFTATNCLQMLHIGPATNAAQTPAVMQAVTFKAVVETNAPGISYQWVIDSNNAAGATNASPK